MPKIFKVTKPSKLIDFVVHTWVSNGLLVPNPNFKYAQSYVSSAVFETLHIRTAASSNLQPGKEADDNVISIPKGWSVDISLFVFTLFILA